MRFLLGFIYEGRGELWIYLGPFAARITLRQGGQFPNGSRWWSGFHLWRGDEWD